MKRRYTVLRIIATIYKLLGILVALLSLLAAVVAFAFPLISPGMLDQYGVNPGAMSGVTGMMAGGAFGVLALLYGLLIALFLFGFGDGIYVLLALEENTRLTASLLQSGMRPAATPVAPVTAAPATPPKEPAPTETAPTAEKS